jgi:hypothetical protein
MKLICATHLFYPAYNTFAIEIGDTVNTGEMCGLASSQRYGKPVGWCSYAERSAGFNFGNYVAASYHNTYFPVRNSYGMHLAPSDGMLSASVLHVSPHLIKTSENISENVCICIVLVYFL